MTIPSRPKDEGKGFPWTSVATPVLLAMVILVALALRVRELSGQSFWFDEAMSVVLGSKPPSEMIALIVTEDIHPPLYALLLHFWMAVAGNGEFAVRFLSVIAGVIMVPLMYVTGRRLSRLGGVEPAGQFSMVGLMGAILAGSSAFYVGYSQEARNYMMVTLLGLLSSYLLLRALPERGRRGWYAYTLAMAAALYTNYTAFLLLVFHALFVLVVRGSYPRATVRRWLLALGAMVLLYSPWIAYTLSQLERINDYWPGTLLVGTALKNTLAQLIAGGGAAAPAMAAPMMFALGLLGLGALALLGSAARGRHAQPILFLLLYLAVPTAILFAIAYSRPKFDPRYLLVATPAFYLTLAWGMAVLLRSAVGRLPLLIRLVLPTLGVAALVGTVAVSTVYGEPTKTKADYRGLVSYIESHAEPGDAVVLLMSAPHPYIYYSTMGITWYPMERVDDFKGAITRLNSMAAEHRRLWFLLWQQEWEDPDDYVMHIMESQATEVSLNATFTGLGLRLFEVSPNRPFSYYPLIQNPADATVGGSLEFWGWNSPSTKEPIGDAVPPTEIVAGNPLQVDLHWIPHVAPQVDLKVVLALIDADRHVWSRTDEVMGTPFYQATKWKPEELVHDRHKVEIPASTPPGDYTLEMRLYDPATLKELAVSKNSGEVIGDALSLGKITVKLAPTVPARPRPPIASWVLDSGVVQLVGGTVGAQTVSPGRSVDVSVQWRAPQQPRSDYSARVALLDGEGRPVGGQVVPMSPAYPTSKWRAGEEMTARYSLAVPADLPKGRYYVGITPLDGQAEGFPSLRYAQLSPLEVLPAGINFDMPPLKNPVGARVGGKADLAGYDVSPSQVKPGDAVQLTLYWRALGGFDRGYTASIRLADEAGATVGQLTAVPIGTTRPTTTWYPGEALVERYTILIPAATKPGSYRLDVGMVASEGGEKLQVSGSNGARLGDSVSLTSIEVSP